jgi:hypothetical protein
MFQKQAFLLMRFMRSFGRRSLISYITGFKTIKKYYMSDAVHGLLGGGWVELEDGAVNVFKVYIGKSNVVKWVTPKGEVFV